MEAEVARALCSRWHHSEHLQDSLGWVSLGLPHLLEAQVQATDAREEADRFHVASAFGVSGSLGQEGLLPKHLFRVQVLRNVQAHA